MILECKYSASVAVLLLLLLCDDTVSSLSQPGGMSAALVHLKPCSINLPHYHASSELLFVSVSLTISPRFLDCKIDLKQGQGGGHAFGGHTGRRERRNSAQKRHQLRCDQHTKGTASLRDKSQLQTCLLPVRLQQWPT